MGCLAARDYDPTTSVSKSTATAIAMTAMDITNLRNSFTVPASGRVLVRLAGTIHGASAMPSILLGVMEGSAVRGRLAPMAGGVGTIAATSFIPVESVFTVSGLTPGASLTWDAAYGVETGQSSSGLKYGGANDTTANNAFGCFHFSIWDA